MGKQKIVKAEVSTSSKYHIIKVHMRVPSANSWTFGTRWSYLKHRDMWYDSMSVLGVNDKQPNRFTYMRVQCHRPKLLDYGNFVGGCKPIGDFLKHNGWIMDDDPWHFECRYIQHVDRIPMTYIAFGADREIMDDELSC